MPLQDLDIDKLELQIIGVCEDRIKWKRKGDTTMADFRKSMETKYTYLCDKSIGLFDMAIRGTLEDPKQEAKMNHMLMLMRSSKSGARSIKAAEHQFGQENFDEYVKPIVERLDDSTPPTCNLTDQGPSKASGKASKKK